MTKYNFDYTKHIDQLVPLLRELEGLERILPKKLAQVTKRHPKHDGTQFTKDEIVIGYRNLAGTNGLPKMNEKFLEQIRKKPTRTQSGVAPITVLTKPFPCPGKCIFCPSDIRMPKSYLSDEPGAQRAERNWFDPYLQTYNRLQALKNIGHSVNKAELIILGGTWSYYPEQYQIWFIKECFRALNDFGKNDDREAIQAHYAQLEKNLKQKTSAVLSNDPKENKENLDGFKIEGGKIDKTYNQTVSKLYVAPEKIGGFDTYQSADWDELFIQQKENEVSDVRNVGLVIETRPDNISQKEVIRIRKLGCTKAQIGFQSLQDSVLEKNKRGHSVAATRRAVKLLRQAGFKIHAHWMANLYGSSVELDKKDYDALFSDQDFRPDELKIYPCSLIGSAELMTYYKKGLWKPYEYEELLEVLSHCLLNTPEYCRLTRVIRDIPSTDIVEGNKKTNFRQIAEQKILKAGKKSKDIRAREIRNLQFDPKDIRLEKEIYRTPVSTEIFLQYVVDADKVIDKRTDKKPDNTQGTKILGFLRLSLPTSKTADTNFIEELQHSAMIREVHVYGRVVDVGTKKTEKTQHLGLGTKLITVAKEIASKKGFEKMAVISAIGTKQYYRGRGFEDGELYQFMDLTK
jgi:elongator complex protein 3